jgi:glutamate--cysteine ligase
MDNFSQGPGVAAPHHLTGMRRGLEKESLRAQPSGMLAMTPHPVALGSALTHPHITTDFCESQVELITRVHSGVQDCIDELTGIQQFTMRALGDEMLWVSSMPCGLPADDAIPLGQYGTSNVGRAKTVYRSGLGYRYGRRMQTISGIHYNWSVPDVSNAAYFGLIRNFRRHAFLLLYLFGASPVVCSTFVAGRQHQLQALSQGSMYLPYATSLRMGRLGYQSDAQASLAVSYNSLDGYAASLQQALTQPYPAYEAIGVKDPDGHYRQLQTTLLQIENEFYGTIRPKRVIFPGERPLHALRERGVEYVEVRLMDLNPFEPVGITAQTLRFLDVFLLHCLHTDSPDDSPEEIAAIGRNQHKAAERGREPGLELEKGQGRMTLTDWGQDIVQQLKPIAAQLDAVHATQDYSRAVQDAAQALQQPERTPSAKVLKVVQEEHGGSFVAFVRAQSLKTRQAMLDLPMSATEQAHWQRISTQSVQDQAAIEAADTMPFDIYLQEYLSPQRLVAKPHNPALAVF